MDKNPLTFIYLRMNVKQVQYPTLLVLGDFNQFEKYARQIESSLPKKE